MKPDFFFQAIMQVAGISTGVQRNIMTSSTWLISFTRDSSRDPEALVMPESGDDRIKMLFIAAWI